MSDGRTMHDIIVERLRGELASQIGREILSSLPLPCVNPGIMMFDTPRLQVLRRTAQGVDITDRYPDLLAVVRTSGLMLTAILEVKRTSGDLYGSYRQIRDYMGRSSLLFLCVPSQLLGAAVTKIRDNLRLSRYKGIINADNGDIVVMPLARTPDIVEQTAFLFNIFTGERYRSGQGGEYRFRDIPICPFDKYPTFKEISGILVRTEYVGTVAGEQRR